VSRLVEICGDVLPLNGKDDRKTYPADESKFSRSPEDAPGLYLHEHGSTADRP